MNGHNSSGENVDFFFFFPFQLIPKKEGQKNYWSYYFATLILKQAVQVCYNLKLVTMVSTVFIRLHEACHRLSENK